MPAEDTGTKQGPCTAAAKYLLRALVAAIQRAIVVGGLSIHDAIVAAALCLVVVVRAIVVVRARHCSFSTSAR